MPTELIVGLDVDTRDEALRAVDQCGDACLWYKVGSQLFTRCGPAIVEELLARRKKIFLDLKFHDIPNTVAKSARAAADLGASLFTVHAVGARDMIRGAREAVNGTPAQILAVTVLTSLTDEILRDEVGIPQSTQEAVPRLAALAVHAGAHGVVCSPKEIALVRGAVAPGTLIVTPGIRPVWASADDQARIMTPAEAARAGADYIVVVRPILKHPEPAQAVQRILEELAI